ncbi:MAG: hypothetical protein DIJKHBIC_03359 [Thermoanaerobaculia bacterium]|nr:hypothetical protein [Thermoanaerobaculia bacterium]
MPSRVRPAYFIAHAGRDTARAEALYDVLHPGVSCFLDKRDLLPGDDWDIELPKAQRLALATVVLVSASTELDRSSEMTRVCLGGMVQG